MGWTWNYDANLLLRNYPSLAEIPEFVERWPGLQEAIRAQGIETGRDKPNDEGGGQRKRKE